MCTIAMKIWGKGTMEKVGFFLWGYALRSSNVGWEQISSSCSFLCGKGEETQVHMLVQCHSTEKS